MGYYILVVLQYIVSYTLSLPCFYLSLTLTQIYAQTILIHSQANSLIHNLSSPSLSFSVFQLSFSNSMARKGRKATQGEKERERGREKWWKPRFKTGQLIFFFRTPPLLTANGTECKFIDLPSCTCCDTQGKPGIRYDSWRAQKKKNIWDYI